MAILTCRHFRPASTRRWTMNGRSCSKLRIRIWAKPWTRPDGSHRMPTPVLTRTPLGTRLERNLSGPHQAMPTPHPQLPPPPPGGCLAPPPYGDFSWEALGLRHLVGAMRHCILEKSCVPHVLPWYIATHPAGGNSLASAQWQTLGGVSKRSKVSKMRGRPAM